MGIERNILLDETEGGVDSLLSEIPLDEIASLLVRFSSDRCSPLFSMDCLVYISEYDVRLFQRIFSRVVLNPDDLVLFIERCRMRRGLGRGIKSAIMRWISCNLREDVCVSYRKQMADAIRITSFPLSSPLARYCLGVYEGGDFLSFGGSIYIAERFSAMLMAGDSSVAEYAICVNPRYVMSQSELFDSSIWGKIAFSLPPAFAARHCCDFIHAGAGEQLAESLSRTDNGCHPFDICPLLDVCDAPLQRFFQPLENIAIVGSGRMAGYLRECASRFGVAVFLDSPRNVGDGFSAVVSCGCKVSSSVPAFLFNAEAEGEMQWSLDFNYKSRLKMEAAICLARMKKDITTSR